MHDMSYKDTMSKDKLQKWFNTQEQDETLWGTTIASAILKQSVRDKNALKELLQTKIVENPNSFKKQLFENAQKALEAPKDANALYDLFAGIVMLIHPEVGQNSSPYKYAEFISAAYVHFIKKNGSPVKTEDLYKITEDLEKFSQPGRQLRDRDINSYYTFEQLAKAIHKSEEKAAQKIERKLSLEDKNKIDAETTVLYTGAEGKVVIPHTPESSRHWGNNTRWCISAKRNTPEFNHYNAIRPILIFLPVVDNTEKLSFAHYTSFKFARAGYSWYDELDDHSYGNEDPVANNKLKKSPKNLEELVKKINENFPSFSYLLDPSRISDDEDMAWDAWAQTEEGNNTFKEIEEQLYILTKARENDIEIKNFAEDSIEAKENDTSIDDEDLDDKIGRNYLDIIAENAGDKNVFATTRDLYIDKYISPLLLANSVCIKNLDELFSIYSNFEDTKSLLESLYVVFMQNPHLLKMIKPPQDKDAQNLRKQLSKKIPQQYPDLNPFDYLPPESLLEQLPHVKPKSKWISYQLQVLATNFSSHRLPALWGNTEAIGNKEVATAFLQGQLEIALGIEKAGQRPR